MLFIDNVSFSYGKKQVLTSITLNMDRGVYGLLGANGAGKTTLISLLVKQLKPLSGSIYLDGKDIQSLNMNYFFHVGYLPQNPRFYPSYTVKEFLLYMAEIKGVPHKKAKHRCDELLEFVNLKDEAKKRVGVCSGGMKQRLGIAQALLNDPEILIFDEPTAGLDPMERIRFRNLISRLGDNHTVLLATHIVTDVEYISKEILLLQKGRLIQQGTLTELLRTIEGFVWNINTATETEVTNIIRTFKVSNVQQQSTGGYRLRVISDQKPFPDATQTQPSLEDVYLWYFTEESYVTPV